MENGTPIHPGTGTGKTGRSESLMEYSIHEIEQYIVRHRLGPGDRLPTERRLAELFGVSRAVVRDAIKTLAAFGILEVRDRVGSFVASMDARHFAGGLSRRLYVKRDSLESLLEVRYTLECSTAEWAALKCDDQGRERLVQLVEENVSAVAANDIKGFRRSDNQLHTAIAEIAQNAIVLDLLQGVFKYLRSFGFFLEGSGSFVSHCSAEHSKIVDAIWQNDNIAARAAMASHLKSVHRHLLDRVDYIDD
jgi:GntR family transcriptional repressor for pyruvate dehydrogenase complex